MGLRKNVASQKWRVFAFADAGHASLDAGEPVTGDAANITAKIAIDWGTATATNDVNPTEVEDGYYVFDLTQAETNGNVLDIYPQSSTAGVQVVGVPGTVFTVPNNFQTLGIESDGDLTKVNTLEGHTAQTGDSYALVNSGTFGLAVIEGLVDDLETRLTATRAGYLDNLSGGAVALASGVNVTQFGGVAGTFSSGRPEVNTSHWGGTAVGSANVRANVVQYGGTNGSFTSGRPAVQSVSSAVTVTGTVSANVIQISSDSVAADNLEAMLDGTGSVTLTTNITGNITGNLSGSVGSVTGNVGGNVVGSVGSVTGGINTSGGTITTLDALDTAQDSQHSTTQSAISGLNDISATDVWAAATRTLTAGTNIVLAKGTGVTGFNDLSAAQVNAEVDTALADINLDHLISSAVDTDFATTVHLNSVIGQLADNGTSASFDRTTDSLEAIASSGGGGPTAADIADAVWDETLADHLTAGSTGASLNAAGSAGDPWTTTLPGSYTGSQAGKILADILTDTADIASLNDLSQADIRTAVGLSSANLDTQLSNIVADTNELQGDWVDGGRLDLILDARASQTSVNNLNDLSQADIRTAVGLASANLDTQLDALPTATEVATQVLASGDVDGYSLEETLKLCLAALAGKLSGAATTSIVIRASDDSKDRITATVDANGNRTAITLDAAG